MSTFIDKLWNRPDRKELEEHEKANREFERQKLELERASSARREGMIFEMLKNHKDGKSKLAESHNGQFYADRKHGNYLYYHGCDHLKEMFGKLTDAGAIEKGQYKRGISMAMKGWETEPCWIEKVDAEEDKEFNYTRL